MGSPLNSASFIIAAVLTGLPELITLVTVLNTLAATAPELRSGVGDVLVTDASARLPFAASHNTNAINHLEALSNAGLQAQVASFLLALRAPRLSATASLSPLAKRGQSQQYVVHASDAASGATLTPGVVKIHDGQGHLSLTVPAGGAPFVYKFVPVTVQTRIHVHGTDPFSGKPSDEAETVEKLVWPTVTVELGPFGTIDVFTGVS